MYKNEPDGQGFSLVTINLDDLFQNIPGREKFDQRFPLFLQSDKFAETIIWRENQWLKYRTEHIHVQKNDGRKKVLFLVGNPAAHSVASGIPFAFEKTKTGDRKEHRFWKALRETCYIDLPYQLNDEDKLNDEYKKKMLFSADYDSEIIFNFEVFFTIPSSASSEKQASDPLHKKAGVEQLRSLFGNKALNRLAVEESERLLSLMGRDAYDAIIVCQKDAYNGIRSSRSPSYSKAALMKRYYDTETDNGIRLFCIPPTYLFSSQVLKQHLKSIKKEIIGG